MSITKDGGVEHTGGGIKRIRGGIDTELGKGTGQHSGRIQVSEGGDGAGSVPNNHGTLIPILA